MPRVITLEWDEAEAAVFVGVKRHLEARKAGLKRTYSSTVDDGWGTDINAAGAEAAVAKALNRFWSYSVNRFHSADIGKSVQVRWTKRPDGCLIVRQHSNDADAYVLVTGELPTYTIVGWIKAADAKNPARLRTPNGDPPAFFVPQDALRPFS